ncbi:hypothetical protein ACFQ88_22545 [Paenibacillus sp. NPDC056579]|uniref:hypothetical protein n=1 Tax=Paenibacillus sp. NPDC056579 TaxID=3345871 RepID=UPI00368299DF
MNKERAKIKEQDIVKIVVDVEERGRFAKMLRVQKGETGELMYTLKVSNYWNFSEMVNLYGEWEGQLWIAMVFTASDIELRKPAPQPHPFLTSKTRFNTNY